MRWHERQFADTAAAATSLQCLEGWRGGGEQSAWRSEGERGVLICRYPWRKRRRWRTTEASMAFVFGQNLKNLTSAKKDTIGKGISRRSEWRKISAS